MKVRVRRVGKKEEEQVIVECVEMTEEVEEICSFVRSRGKMLPGVFFAHMKNGEKLMITRQYVPVLKKIMMREEGR